MARGRAGNGARRRGRRAQGGARNCRWDATFVLPKLGRALDGRDRHEQGEDFDDDPVQNDWNGSAKVALISLERSEVAWRVIAQSTGDADPAALAEQSPDCGGRSRGRSRTRDPSSVRASTNRIADPSNGVHPDARNFLHSLFSHLRRRTPHAHHDSGSRLRSPLPRQGPRVRRGCHPDHCARDWRQHRDVHRRQRRPAPAVALRASRAAGDGLAGPAGARRSRRRMGHARQLRRLAAENRDLPAGRGHHRLAADAHRRRGT